MEIQLNDDGSFTVKLSPEELERLKERKNRESIERTRQSVGKNEVRRKTRRILKGGSHEEDKIYEKRYGEVRCIRGLCIDSTSSK